MFRVKWRRVQRAAVEHHGQMDISYFAETNHHQRFTRFGIKQADRLSHFYIVGKTGVGKTTLMEALATGDVQAGRGFALIDPHGDLAELMKGIAERAGNPFIYLDAADPKQPYGYNPLRRVRPDKIPLAAGGLLDAMKKLWNDAWGVRMEHVLRNALYTLIERDDATLPDILRLFSDEVYRRGIVATVKNPVVKAYWLNEFEKYTDRQRAEVVAPVQNKLGGLLTDPRLYHLMVTPEVPISFRRIMDEGGILIANLSKGRLGEESANILGSMMVATIANAALSRAETPTDTRRPFFLYVDEFQSFTTLAFATMMPELRKMAVGLVLAHQHLHQLGDDVRHAVLGNAGSVVSFRLGAEDAAYMSREFAPTFEPLDFLRLPNWSFYVRLMIDGAPSGGFSGQLIHRPFL